MIQIVKPGLLTTIQDLGRPGYAHLGVPRSGALDPPALREANRLIGNVAAAAVLETTLTGCTVYAQSATLVAVTGAPAEITVGGAIAPFGVAVEVPAGAEVKVGPALAGVRSYVAFAGGVAVEPVLGSRATDTLSGLGPGPLRAGEVLPLGIPTGTPPTRPVRAANVRIVPAPEFDGPMRPEVVPPLSIPDTALISPVERAPSWQDITLRVRLGPRHDWFTEHAIEALLRSPYTLSPKSNRVGARLTGETLSRAIPGELPSEGLVLGAVQVPADGQPLVFLADHPTTGGYPVIAVVDPVDLPLLAQARPGATVRFHGHSHGPEL